MQIIDEVEPQKRGPYGGAVGYIDFTGNMDTCIALRTLVIQGKTAYIQAGGGVVYDSDPGQRVRGNHQQGARTARRRSRSPSLSSRVRTDSSRFMTYDRTLIVIRERSFLDLLDLALVVVRDRPVVLGLTALVGIAPFAALNVWLLSADRSLSGLWIPLLLMEAPWATAPLTLVLGDLMFGVRPRPGRIVKTLVVSFPALFLTQFLVRGILLSDSDRICPGAGAVRVPERSAVARAGRDLSRLRAFASDQPRF